MRIRDLLLIAFSSAPVAAQASWSQLYPGLVPPARNDAMMGCHEAAGSLLLLFGGSNTGSLLQDCWRLDGAAWSQVLGPLPPSRRSAALAYDAVRQRLVLFGGTAGSKLQDTWEWDGVTWTQRLPIVKPPVRSGHAMAYDRLRGVTVLYGGTTDPSNNILGDLWEWDGTQWTQRTPAISPGLRTAAVMAFDPVQQRVLLHGGWSPLGGGTLPHNDTWTWDGTNWQQMNPSTPPPYRSGGRAVTDLHRGRIVLQGGGVDSFAWEWDGSQWHILLQASPSDRTSHSMAFDHLLRRVVVFGGTVPGFGAMVDDTWVYQTPLPAAVEPFGSGCAGSAGTPSLANVPYHLPWLGDTVRNRVDHIAPGELGAVFVSSFGSTPPIDLSFVDMPGCELLVPLDSLDFVVANAGTAEWSLFVPMTPVLAGVVWRQQAFPLDAAANPFGLSASNGVEAVFGVR